MIPPGASAGFDIIFKVDEPTSFRRSVPYVINGLHAFKFTATAEVVPPELHVRQRSHSAVNAQNTRESID